MRYSAPCLARGWSGAGLAPAASGAHTWGGPGPDSNVSAGVAGWRRRFPLGVASSEVPMVNAVVAIRISTAGESLAHRSPGTPAGGWSGSLQTLMPNPNHGRGAVLARRK